MENFDKARRGGSVDVEEVYPEKKEQRRLRKRYNHHYVGDPRQKFHPYDRKSGTGAGKKDVQKGGHGKGNWGDLRDEIYLKKDRIADILENKEIKEEEVENAESNPMVDNFEKNETIKKIEITTHIKEEQQQMSLEDRVMDEEEGRTLSEYLNLNKKSMPLSEIKNPEQNDMFNLAGKSYSKDAENV